MESLTKELDVIKTKLDMDDVLKSRSPQLINHEWKYHEADA